MPCAWSDACQGCDVQAYDVAGVGCAQVAAWINNTRTRLQQGGRPPGGRPHRSVAAGGSAADLVHAPAPIPELGLAASIGGVGNAAPQRAAVVAQLASDRMGPQQLDRPTVPPDEAADPGIAGQMPVQSSSTSAQKHKQQQQAQGPQAAQPAYSPSPAQAAGTWEPLPGQAWQQGTLRTGRPYLGAVPYATPQPGPQKRRRGMQQTDVPHAAPLGMTSLRSIWVCVTLHAACSGSLEWSCDFCTADAQKATIHGCSASSSHMARSEEQSAAREGGHADHDRVWRRREAAVAEAHRPVPRRCTVRLPLCSCLGKTALACFSMLTSMGGLQSSDGTCIWSHTRSNIAI